MLEIEAVLKSATKLFLKLNKVQVVTIYHTNWTTVETVGDVGLKTIGKCGLNFVPAYILLIIYVFKLFSPINPNILFWDSKEIK